MGAKRPSVATRRAKRAAGPDAALQLVERAAQWRDLGSRAIATELADALMELCGLDALVIRIDLGAEGRIQISRPSDIPAQHLVPALDGAGDDESGRGHVVRIAPGGELSLAASSSRAGFPADSDLALRMGAEHATVAVRNAQLRSAIASGDARRDEFLSAFGHELRDRLAPTLTALGLLKENPTGARERQIIERQVTQLAHLVNDLLELSDVVRGRLKLKREAIDLHTVVTGALDIAAPLFGDGRARIVAGVPRGLVVEGDRARLTQAIAILLARAARCTDAGGHVEVAADRTDGHIELRVRDDATSLDGDRVPTVFDPFTPPAETEGRRGAFGMGLGLALVRGLVGLHGGSLAVTRGPEGRGTEFAVRLAAVEQRAAAPRTVIPPAASTTELAKGLRVLVVDDNVDAADALAMVLEGAGMVVRVAYGALQALQLAESRRFDAAVLDIGLPVMDGFELAQKLRRSRFGADLEMFALTGFAGEADRQRSREVGFRRHFVKPIESPVLIAAIVQDAGRGPRGQA